MADVAVVTASFGGYDVPHPQAAQDVDVDWYYFTDDRPAADQRPPPWTYASAVPPFDDNPRMDAKRYRMVPWEILDRWKPYRFMIWLDASMEVTSPAFAREAIASVGYAPLAAWKHPRRDCVYSEILGSLIEAPEKYEPVQDALVAQGAHYRDEGYPSHHGLYATGTLVWNLTKTGGDGAPHAYQVLGEEWLHECRLTTYQDQVSLPVVAWRLGLQVATFPYSQIETRRRRQRSRLQQDPFATPDQLPGFLENRWLRIHPHTRDD